MTFFLLFFLCFFLQDLSAIGAEGITTLLQLDSNNNPLESHTALLHTSLQHQGVGEPIPDPQTEVKGPF